MTLGAVYGPGMRRASCVVKQARGGVVAAPTAVTALWSVAVGGFRDGSGALAVLSTARSRRFRGGGGGAHGEDRDEIKSSRAGQMGWWSGLDDATAFCLLVHSS
ncbi:hypothetical protein DFH09DRAFT_1100607 [Mycena vulgaris]|nr:hypothetical protein DFH09DRAFT_1100607 [Mycena vulgaris]